MIGHLKMTEWLPDMTPQRMLLKSKSITKKKQNPTTSNFNKIIQPCFIVEYITKMSIGSQFVG